MTREELVTHLREIFEASIERGEVRLLRGKEPEQFYVQGLTDQGLKNLVDELAQQFMAYSDAQETQEKGT